MKKFISLFIILFLTWVSKTPAQAQSTDPNFKVAFIGDSSAGNNFQSVLNLIKAEGAQMVLHQGDFDYSAGPQVWMDKINNTLGPDFPYLGSDGNHDIWDTDGYAAFFKDRLTKLGIPAPGGILPPSYSAVFKGLKMVFVKENGDPSFIQSQLANDTHTWKICSWHKNMTTMQLGTKGNEQGWPDYETCRQYGAIIATGHEHTYERTKTFSNTANSITNLIIDSTLHPKDAQGVPGNPKNVAVAPGKTFVFVSGLGGNGPRNQDRCLPTTYPYSGASDCNYIWASVWTTDQGGSSPFGALFITFNYAGNPNKAHAYFKTISGQVVDEFDITAGVGGPIPTNTPAQITNTPPVGGKPGDANGDNKVDGLDYVVWLQNYNKQVTGGAGKGDFNKNGFVDGLDYVIWLDNYLK